jgi:hypothetical protein
MFIIKITGVTGILSLSGENGDTRAERRGGLMAQPSSARFSSEELLFQITNRKISY